MFHRIPGVTVGLACLLNGASAVARNVFDVAISMGGQPRRHERTSPGSGPAKNVDGFSLSAENAWLREQRLSDPRQLLSSSGQQSFSRVQSLLLSCFQFVSVVPERRKCPCDACHETKHIDASECPDTYFLGRPRPFEICPLGAASRMSIPGRFPVLMSV